MQQLGDEGFEDGAVVTAWVEVPRGVIPIGRATVKNGKVRVKLPPRFMQGRALRSLKKKLRLSASMPGRVSVPLTIEWEE